MVKKAKISPATITRIEGGYPANASTLNNLEWTLEELGVVCAIDSNGAVVVKLSSRYLSDEKHGVVQKELDKRREHDLQRAKEREQECQAREKQEIK